jgi:signal transduction histidine kinase
MAVLIATIIVDVLVWNVERKNIMSEATSNALNEMYSLADAYNQTFERSQFTSNSDEVMDIQLQYFFKTRLDEYTICVRYQEIDGTLVNDAEHGYFVYNHTVLSLDDVENNDYNSIANETISYGTLHYQDSEYLICKYTTKNRLSIYHLTCIDYAKDKLRNLTMYMIVITFSVMVVMSIIVALILRHSLRSLKELNATAADIAKGNYDKRVNVRGKNEIATLGTTFNQMAEAVETRTKSLEESERQKTLFMGNLTHELKTPLAAISGYAQTLLTVRLDEADEAEALGYIDEECKRLERLSKKMLRLLELDTEQKLELHEIPVRQLFERTGRLCRKLLETKGVTLQYEEHGECFLVEEDLMTEVLVNLVDNANKASKQGDTIRLIANDHQILVQDTGCGIPEEEQKKILEPFYMIDKSRSRKNGGAGLGLALTALILKRHDVTLAIESEEGKGTTMILNFPVG